MAPRARPALSPYGQRSTIPSPATRMMAAFAADFRQGVDINLGVGYVNQETMPAVEVREALDYVLSHPAEYPNALNYGSAQGSPRLAAAIRAFYRAGGFGRIDERVLGRSDMLIGASGATSILMGLAQVIKPGIVVTSDPRYYIYCEYLERAGFEVLAVPEDSEGMRADILECKLKALGSRRRAVRFFYVSTVGNPTSTVVSTARRRAIVEAGARLSRQIGARIPVVFDAAYEALVHAAGVERPESALDFDEHGLVYEVGSFSKVLAPALRVGFLLGPHDELFDALLQQVSDTSFSASLVVQEMAAFLLERNGLAQVGKVRAEYARRAGAVAGWIQQYLGERVEDIRGGQAGFYYYLTLRGIATHERSPFFRYLARTTGSENVDRAAGKLLPRVVYLPGQHCVDPSGDLRAIGRRQLRISYGYETTNNIQTGLRLMGDACAYAAAGRKAGAT